MHIFIYTLYFNEQSYNITILILNARLYKTFNTCHCFVCHTFIVIMMGYEPNIILKFIANYQHVHWTINFVSMKHNLKYFYVDGYWLFTLFALITHLNGSLVNLWWQLKHCISNLRFGYWTNSFKCLSCPLIEC